MKKHRPWTFFVCKIWTSGLSRVIEVSGNYSGAWVHQHTMYCSLIPSGTTRCIRFRVHCTIFANAAQGQLKEYLWKPVIQSLDIPLWTPLMSSVLHDQWRAQICLDVAIYSRNTFFRVGPNISEKFVQEETNFRGVQIVPFCCWCVHIGRKATWSGQSLLLRSHYHWGSWTWYILSCMWCLDRRSIERG